jgi:hypothetical protein
VPLPGVRAFDLALLLAAGCRHPFFGLAQAIKDHRYRRACPRTHPGAESIIIDFSPPLGAGLTEALRSLGYSREEAERRVARASETLGESASEEEILAEALRRAPAPAPLSS